MKKITFALCALLFAGMVSAQTYSSGVLQLSGNYTAKFDITSDTVTLTMVGPSTVYLGLGFDVVNMLNTGDCVIYTGGSGTGTTILTDRRFNNATSLPPVDTGGSGAQNWNVTSNTVSGGVRTLVATRARVSSGDYTFPFSATSFNLAWSMGNSFELVYHASRGHLSVGLTLGLNDFKVDDFKIYPNPAEGFTTVELPQGIAQGTVKIYDNLGRVVRNQEITVAENRIITEDLMTGSYLVVLRTDYGNATKTLLVK